MERLSGVLKESRRMTSFCSRPRRWTEPKRRCSDGCVVQAGIPLFCRAPATHRSIHLPSSSWISATCLAFLHSVESDLPRSRQRGQRYPGRRSPSEEGVAAAIARSCRASATARPKVTRGVSRPGFERVIPPRGLGCYASMLRCA